MSRFAGKELRPQEGVSVSCWRPQKSLVRKSRRKNRLLDRKGFDIFVTINIAQVILFVPDLPFESIRFLFQWRIVLAPYPSNANGIARRVS